MSSIHKYSAAFVRSVPLVRMLSELGMEMTLPEQRVVYRCLDEDGSGAVELDEFLSFLLVQGLEPAPDAGRSHVQSWRRRAEVEELHGPLNHLNRVLIN